MENNTMRKNNMQAMAKAIDNGDLAVRHEVAQQLSAVERFQDESKRLQAAIDRFWFKKRSAS